ncbi:MAG: hypothetical protein U5J63_13315 [Fodinibius sp.]|nr:hypothetical protein [Fodinibius sp.]
MLVQRYWDDKVDNHISRGASCDPVTSLRKIGNYITKYLTKKEDDNSPNQGRYLGCTRSWGVIKQRSVILTGAQLIHFRRLVKLHLKGAKKMQKLVTKPMNLTVFGNWQFIEQALDYVVNVH